MIGELVNDDTIDKHILGHFLLFFMFTSTHQSTGATVQETDSIMGCVVALFRMLIINTEGLGAEKDNY